MLALLHITTGQLVRFPVAFSKTPVIDLEFAYKLLFYNKKISYCFSTFIEKTIAKIIVGESVAFYKLNPGLKNADPTMAEFQLVDTKNVAGLPNLDLSQLKVVPHD